MGETTLISWARHTFNPWIGCTKVSNGERGACENCYAENYGHRFGVVWGAGEPRRRTAPSTWREPLAWDRAAAKAGERPFVFCASLADILDNEVPIEWLAEVIDLARRTPNLIWLFLTKRAPLIIKRLREALGRLGLAKLPRNIAIGISVVTQAEADRDIPNLLAAKVVLRPAFAFVSLGPLMGPVDLRRWLAYRVRMMQPWAKGDIIADYGRLDWVIVEGESGPHARPLHPDWVRSLRDQCLPAETAFHFKQWGEWSPQPGDTVSDRCVVLHSGAVLRGRHVLDHPDEAAEVMFRVGKKAAGRELDGRTWDEFPKVAA